MDADKSCLVGKLSHYLRLRSEEVALLTKLEKTEREYDGDAVVAVEGADIATLFVVKSGWLYSAKQLPNGGRLVVSIHHPGDIIGLDDLALRRRSMSLVAATDICVCPFSKADIDEVFECAPRLTALLFSIFSRDHVVLVDTLRAISRMQSPARIAFMMLDLISRLRVNDPGITNTFRMPLTQTVIGDALGLSNVSVSRSWSRMENQGLFKKDGDRVTILDEDGMKNICDYENRYREIDISWFPDPNRGVRHHRH